MTTTQSLPIRRLAALAALLFALLGIGTAGAAEPVARAVLFFSPTCPHCHIVMQEVLPPLEAQYGDQLEIVSIDATRPDGRTLYEAAITTLAIPNDRTGFPTLVFGTTVLVGSEEIPAQLPGLIEGALAAGGNDWPAIPGLEASLAADPGPQEEATESMFQRDPLGNTAALTLMLGMVVSVFVVAVTVRPPFDRPLPPWRAYAIPLVALAGMAVASYLTYVEISGALAVCGPVGDCNAVQQSPYARLFGVLPVGLLGLLGYAVILLAWAVRQYSTGDLARWAAITLLGATFVGTLFSIYLTFLELFVIGAVCMWCLASAALMTALLWLVAPRGAVAVARGKGRGRRPAHGAR